MGLKDFFNKLVGKAKVVADQAEDFADKHHALFLGRGE